MRRDAHGRLEEPGPGSWWTFVTGLDGSPGHSHHLRAYAFTRHFVGRSVPDLCALTFAYWAIMLPDGWSSAAAGELLSRRLAGAERDAIGAPSWSLPNKARRSRRGAYRRGAYPSAVCPPPRQTDPGS